MGLLNRLFGAPPETKQSTMAHMLMGQGQAAWSKRDFARFAKEGYSQNVVAYQAINRVSEAVASVKWEVARGDDVLTDHPLLALMEKPNPSQGRSEFFSAYIGFLMVSGNAYVEKVRDGSQAPRELYVQRSDRMSITPSASGVPARYTYSLNGKQTSWDVDPSNGASDILHTKLFHPLDDWYGLSPMEAGAYGIDQHNEAMGWMQSLLQNSARPSGALVVGEGQSLTDDQFRRMKDQIEGQHSGGRNAGRPMLLEGGLDWKEMGLSPTDMGIVETKYSAARDVSLAFGVPPQLIGIPGDNTYSNYAEARLAFWEDTVLPLLSHVSGDLNGWFADDFDAVELVPNLEDIPAIVDKRQTLWEMADRSQDLTVNERRELKGYGPVEGGDVLLVGSGMIPLGDASLTVDELNAPQDEDEGEPSPEEAKMMLRLAYGG